MIDFDRAVAEGETYIRSLGGLQEGLQVEFKGHNDKNPFIANGRLAEEHKKTVAKAVSAFSNSAGGVLVMGVDCRKDETGVDQVVGFTPVPQMKLLISEVRQAAADLVQPKASGVRVEGIPSAEDPDRGWVIVDVPRSERRPHRSEAKKDKQYYKRIGPSSFPMEHYDIEDAFRRLQAPELSTSLSVQVQHTMVRLASVWLRVAVENTGQVSIRSCSLRIVAIRGGQTNDSPYVRLTPTPNGPVVRDVANNPIHPGERFYFPVLELRVDISAGEILSPSGGRIEHVGVKFVIAAEDMRPVEGEYILQKDELLRYCR